MANINFKTMNPVQIRTGGFFFEVNLLGPSGLPSAVRRVLYVGQRLAAGSVAAGVLKEFFTYLDMVGYAGEGSMLAEQARIGIAAAEFYGAVNERWFVALDDNAGGVKATGTITLTGAPTAAGTLAIYIVGQQVEIAVNVGDTLTAIAANIVTALGLVPTLPVTATSAVGVVTLTSKWKGLTGNDIDVRINYEANDDVTPPGLAVAIAPMAGGTTNPTVAAVIAALGDNWFTDIVMPYTDSANLAAFEAELVARWGATRQNDGTLWSGIRGTFSAIDTFGLTQDSQFAQFPALSTSPTPAYLAAAIEAEVCSNSLEQDPALPLSTLQLPGLLAPAETDRFTWQENNVLLNAGISTLTYDRQGNTYIQQMITSYQTNSSGVEDTSYLYTEDVATASYIRYAINTHLALKFPRYKFSATEIAVQPGQLIATPMKIRGELSVVFQDLQDEGIIVDAEEATKTATILPVDGNDSACQIGFNAKLIRGLRGVMTQGNLST